MTSADKPCKEPCPKCGHGDISRQYIATGDKIPCVDYNKPPTNLKWWHGYNFRATRDHIHHLCKCCGYTWQGMPMRKVSKKAESVTTGVDE